MQSSPDSNGTITQSEAGQDFPADVVFQLFLDIETPFDPPLDVLHNDEAVNLVASISAIPPVSGPLQLGGKTPLEIRDAILDQGPLNIFTATNLPVELFDRDNNLVAFFGPGAHETLLTGLCGDGLDSDMDGLVDEEGEPNNEDTDGDGFIDEDNTCPSNIGGLAELPGVAGDTPLETAGSSGGSAGVVAAAVAAGTAVVALGGAGWFARRRRLR